MTWRSAGFGSAALGHVCLLNLQDQTYPDSEGTKTRGWPSWTLPVMQWCKEQGGVTGYPHSALHVNAEQAAAWMKQRFDADGDGSLSAEETSGTVLPAPLPRIDVDGDGRLSGDELRVASDQAADELPNLALPALNGAGAMEVFVTAPAGVCDFISAMDTARVSEWNTWYHLMNCGLPLKLSGETDFPCMSSRWVGQGRVYVQLGKVERVDFGQWCEALAQGRSYVCDGYAHALEFEVQGQMPGFEPVRLERPGIVDVSATVAFAPALPRAVAYGTIEPPEGRRMAGDTIHLHAPRSNQLVEGGMREVELIVNGQPVAKRQIPADGRAHTLSFQAPVSRSSWVALRQFPQLHTNPVIVQVGGKPIRASRDSALWCAESVRLLWNNRRRFIDEAERPAARKAYDAAEAYYRQVAAEAE